MTPTLAAALAFIGAAGLILLGRVALSLRLEVSSSPTKFVHDFLPEGGCMQVLNCGVFLMGVGAYSPEWFVTPFWLLPALIGVHLCFRQSRLALRVVRHGLRWANDPVFPDRPLSKVDVVGMFAIVLMPIPVILWGSYELAKMISVM